MSIVTGMFEAENENRENRLVLTDILNMHAQIVKHFKLANKAQQ